jgi:hypothetical protein
MQNFVSGWTNRHQQHTIEYLITENQVLKEKLGKKRILLNDDQRRRLAVKGKLVGRNLLSEIATIVTPDTILRWHRQLRKEVNRTRSNLDIPQFLGLICSNLLLLKQ